MVLPWFAIVSVILGEYLCSSRDIYLYNRAFDIFG
jgi:hypothetical protein